MIERVDVWIVIGAVGAGTYATRAVLFALAGRLSGLSPPVREALRMIPSAALAALTVPALLRPDGGAIDLVSAELFAGVLAAAVAWRTRELLPTIVVALVAVTVLQQVPALA